MTKTNKTTPNLNKYFSSSKCVGVNGKYRQVVSVSSDHARTSFYDEKIEVIIQKNSTYLGSDLVATLASLHMDDFSHF